MIKIKDYYVPKNDTHFIEYLKRNDHYQEEQRNRAISYVENWGFAIDIGANIGLWSKDLSSYFDRLVCFEPNPYCEDYLKKNVNLDKSKINSCALGEKNEIKNLFIHPLNSGASSFVNKTKIGFKKDSGVIYGEFPKETLQKKVEVKKLDDFNYMNIDFIKIDVQGYELSVLKGAYSTLKFNNPILCIEEDNLINSETIPCLENLNYVVVDVIVKEHVFKKKQL